MTFRYSLLVVLLALNGLFFTSNAPLAAAGNGPADTVKKMIQSNEVVRVYCQGCKHVAFKALSVESLEFEERGGTLQYCVVNGEYVPPERIYVSRHDRWTNLATLANLETEDQPRMLDPRVLSWEEAQALEGYFVGSIGADLTVQMSFSFMYGAVEGEYSYDKVGTPLRIWAKKAEVLSGHPRRYAMELVEEVDTRTTGFFYGVFDPSRESFGGIWAPRQGYETRTFDLARVATVDVLRGIGSSVSYPRFLETSGHWQKLNGILKRKAQSHFEPHDEVDAEGMPLYGSSFDQRLVYYSDRVVCIHGRASHWGGAHPYTTWIGNCYGGAPGTAAPLELKSVLDLEDDTIAKLVGGYVEAELDGLFGDEFGEPIEKNIATFWLTPEGLTLCVAPEGSRCKGMGSMPIAIPYSWFRRYEIPLGVLH